MALVAAVDLGASSGRVMVARVEPGRLELTEAARFGNVPVRAAGTLHRDVLRLYRGVLEGLRAAFTNEAGVDGRVRFLRNAMGLWLLQECLRQWEVPLDGLLEEAARLGRGAVIDAGDPEFLAPGDMPARIVSACERTGQPAPDSRAAVVRCIVDSLASAHARALADAQRISGVDVDVVHLVGGGARNPLPCRLTADACGVPVEAGPVEATALGNALVQARSLGAAPPDLSGMRSLLRATQPIHRYTPSH